MATALVQKAHGVIANLGAGGSVSFVKPTVAGNCVLLLFAFIPTHALGSPNITDDSGTTYDYWGGFYSVFDVANTDMVNDWGLFEQVGEKAVGGGNSMNIDSMRTITFFNFTGQTNPCYVWMYELSYIGSPDAGPPNPTGRTWARLANPTGGGATNNASATPVCPVAGQLSISGGGTGLNFMVCFIAADSMNFTAVTDGTSSGTVWTLDAAQGGVVVAYAEPTGTGHQQAEFMNAAGAHNFIALYVVTPNTTPGPSGLCTGSTPPNGNPNVGARW